MFSMDPKIMAQSASKSICPVFRTQQKMMPAPKKKQCTVCWKFFASNSSLQVHMRVHTKEKPYICNLCGNNFTQKSSLNTHMILHSGEKNFSCSYCEKRFALKIYKTTHEKTCKAKTDPNMQEKAFLCSNTTVSLPTVPHRVQSRYCLPLGAPDPSINGGGMATFSRHFHHQVQPMHINLMDLSNTTQNTPHSAKADALHFQRPPRHVITIENFGQKNMNQQSTKPFHCTLCGQSYSQKSSLKTHLILHTGIKNFACDWCEKKFALKLYKTSHEKSCKKKHQIPQIPVQIPVTSEGFDIHEVEQLISL